MDNNFLFAALEFLLGFIAGAGVMIAVGLSVARRQQQLEQQNKDK